MGLFKLSTLALVAGVTASTGYGAPPAPVVVATDVLTVTSFVKAPPAPVDATALSFSLPSGLSSWVPGAPTSSPVVTEPVRPLPSSTNSVFVDLSSFEPQIPHGNVSTIAPPTTILPSVASTTLVVSATANSTGFHYGTPTGSAVATKTTGPDSGVGKVEFGVAAALAAVVAAMLGA